MLRHVEKQHIQCGVMVQEFEGQGAQLKHEAAVIQFDEMELEGYGPFRCCQLDIHLVCASPLLSFHACMLVDLHGVVMVKVCMFQI